MPAETNAEGVQMSTVRTFTATLKKTCGAVLVRASMSHLDVKRLLR